MTREDIIQKIYEKKIIAIVRGLSSENMLGLANALYAGGIELMEVTFNQKDPSSWSDTTDAIKLLSCEMEGRMVIGAGTVTTPELVQMAYDAGAKYIVSPDTKKAVIEKTKELAMVSLPGALTPSEITSAYEYGADFVKLFPVSNLGVSYVKAVRAPLSHIPMLAVGGVNEKNFKDFLDAGVVGAGVGGNLVNKSWIEAGEFDRITALAREFVSCID